MAQKPSNDVKGKMTNAHRKLLIAQINAYLAICVRKHDFDKDSIPDDYENFDDVELLSQMHMLRDLAHLPPE